MPTRNFISAMILAGLVDDAIIKILILHQLPFDTSDIAKIRKIINVKDTHRSMVEENQLRFRNREHAIIHDMVITEYEYQADFIALINNVTFATSLYDRGKFQDIQLIGILHDSKKRSCVENFALTFEGFPYMGELTKALGLEDISKNEYLRYCYFFWDVNKFNQQKLAAYLRVEQRQEKYGRKFIDPINESFIDVINMLGSPEEKDIQQSLNKLLFRTSQDIQITLENGKYPSSKSISRLKHFDASLNKLGGPLNQHEVESEYNGDYDSSMIQDKPCPIPEHHIFFIPHLNLIRLCFFAGYTSEMVENLMDQLGFNHIPEFYLKQIQENCNATEAGADMIKKNSEYLHTGADLFEAAEVRKTFRYMETYTSLIKWLQEGAWLSQFPLKEIFLDKDRRSFLESALMVSLPLNRLKRVWHTKFNETLTTIHLNTYRYYLWNTKVDFKKGLYQYLIQDPHNKVYQEHRDLFEKDYINFLNFHHLLTQKEKEHKMQLDWHRQNHLREIEFQKGNYLLPSALQNALFMSLDKAMKNDKRLDKQYYRTQLERIFSKITGKKRNDLSLDQIKNEKRLIKNPVKDINIIEEVIPDE